VPYVDPNTVHNPATSTVAPAAWGDVLRDNGEFLINPPVCSVFHSIAELIPTATAYKMAANSENFDSDAMHSTVTNNSRITIQTAGRYQLTATVTPAASAAGTYRSAHFIVNNTTTYLGFTGDIGGGALDDTISIVRNVTLAASDYVEVMVQQDTGGNLNYTMREFAVLFMTR
jgi:hypothetical protein